MIITIDGPVASGKSTVARLLAEQFGYAYLNSGLLFRALAYFFVKESGCTGLSDVTQRATASGEAVQFTQLTAHQVEEAIAQVTVEYSYRVGQGAQVTVQGIEVTACLKEPAIEKAASLLSMDPAIRQFLLEYQRDFARDKDIVVDGRDAGTVVFPQADFKFYITASLEVRALRWQREQLLHGNHISREESIQAIAERDHRDSTRPIAPLKPADDAFMIDTTTLTVQDVIQLITDALQE